MFDQLRLFPEQAAEIAYRVDALLFFMLIVTGIVAIGVYIVDHLFFDPVPPQIAAR